MDELLKLIKELLAREPKPKGGVIMDTPAGIDFIGRKLTREERGADIILSGKLTDASRFKPFSIQNIGRDERYRKINEYYGDIQKAFEKSINFLKQNPDIRITPELRENVLYNLGVLRRVQDEKTKLEKGILSENKTLESILNPKKGEVVELKNQRPIAKDLFTQILDEMFPEMKPTKPKINDEADDIFDVGGFAKQLEESGKRSEREARVKRLYEGPGYDSPNSANYRGYGSFFLPKLHEKGIINLDKKIYDNLVKGAHHYGNADFFAPDPIRIWRKHFGDDVFEKLDNFDPQNEDIFRWLERNNVQPILKQGPEDALEYQTTGEILENLNDDLDAFSRYRDPKSAGEDAQFYFFDKPELRLERLGFHGQNIQKREAALQRLDPDAFREYSRTKPKFDSNILPFKELNAEGGIVGLYI